MDILSFKVFCRQNRSCIFMILINDYFISIYRKFIGSSQQSSLTTLAVVAIASILVGYILGILSVVVICCVCKKKVATTRNTLQDSQANTVFYDELELSEQNVQQLQVERNVAYGQIMSS